MIGRVFGRWEVIDEAQPYIRPKDGVRCLKWKCRCVCGNIKDVRQSSLLRGDSTSCGCYAKERASETSKTHGLRSHVLYDTWRDMIRRCTDINRKDYKHYGGRGITVCDDWLDNVQGISKFIEDMFPTYQDGLELDRIDVNGNYCKENCRWVTRREQVINRRPFGSTFDTKFITYNNEIMCISQWAEKVGIPYKVLVDRLGKLKWSVEKALTTPKMSKYRRVCND